MFTDVYNDVHVVRNGVILCTVKLEWPEITMKVW